LAKFEFVAESRYVRTVTFVTQSGNRREPADGFREKRSGVDQLVLQSHQLMMEMKNWLQVLVS
jgi:hypothetical protein